MTQCCSGGLLDSECAALIEVKRDLVSSQNLMTPMCKGDLVIHLALMYEESKFHQAVHLLQLERFSDQMLFGAYELYLFWFNRKHR